ncbi:hypothetical protein G5B31_00465 [Rhodobacter sp. SGA-6-6]|uniref:YciI family protein n=1 Tax=Rhodobacter sp. SGA-6-6 TaxID=2710882 RepID=UPI0013EC91B5|nr:YciI family protein [Rhodobacter sp. SGA-6-6]NGM44000.1 hypothetical protein [Rhodobacter sp. SGA-6-6]
MPTFLYRILPPRADFAATVTEAEMAVMGRHFGYLQGLHAAGRLRFVGRAENGDFGLAVVEAADEAEARAVAEADPAVAEGLMRAEVHAFRIVDMDG